MCVRATMCGCVCLRFSCRRYWTLASSVSLRRLASLRSTLGAKLCTASPALGWVMNLSTGCSRRFTVVARYVFTRRPARVASTDGTNCDACAAYFILFCLFVGCCCTVLG